MPSCTFPMEHNNYKFEKSLEAINRQKFMEPNNYADIFLCLAINEMQQSNKKLDFSDRI